MRVLIFCTALAVLTGCAATPRQAGGKSEVAGEYTFAKGSRYAGRPLVVRAEGDDLFVIVEGHKTALTTEAGHYRFTTGDKVWNENRTATKLEWFIIAYDADRKQYYLGSPKDTKWRQYLNRN
jgi:hypothetical protein